MKEIKAYISTGVTKLPKKGDFYYTATYGGVIRASIDHEEGDQEKLIYKEVILKSDIEEFENLLVIYRSIVASLYEEGASFMLGAYVDKKLNRLHDGLLNLYKSALGQEELGK